MATLHIKGQVCQYVYTGTANCASIPFVGIAVPLNLYGIMQQKILLQKEGGATLPPKAPYQASCQGACMGWNRMACSY